MFFSQTFHVSHSLQVNSLDRKNPMKGEGRPKHNMVQIMGKFGLKVGVNGM